MTMLGKLFRRKSGRVLLGQHFGKDIADMLGLQNTRCITITIPYNDFVTVDVDFLLLADDAKTFTGYLQRRRYEMRLLDQQEPERLVGEPHNLRCELVDTTKHGDTYRLQMFREVPE